ncbi:MAG: hypothetical protein WCL27_07630 [Betaproteobacteria bacterium]
MLKVVGMVVLLMRSLQMPSGINGSGKKGGFGSGRSSKSFSASETASEIAALSLKANAAAESAIANPLVCGVFDRAAKLATFEAESRSASANFP